MNPTAMTLRDPIGRGRGPLTRAAAAVGGLAILLTATATGLTHCSTPATSMAPISLSPSVIGLGVSGVTRTALSALARTGGQQ